MIEYYSSTGLASEPVLVAFYGASFAATTPPALISVSLPDTPVVSEGVPPAADTSHLSVAPAELALILMAPEPEPEPEPEPKMEAGPDPLEPSRSRLVTFKDETGEGPSSVRSTSK
jgi:hypothetical protein